MFKSTLSKITKLLASTIVGTITIVISTTVFSSEAHAWLQVCNKTNESVWVAYGYLRESIAGATQNSQGWWNIQPNQCAIVNSNSAASEWETFDGNYGPFYYAESNSGKLIWTGNTSFCVENNAFDYTTNGYSCPSNYFRLKFRRLNTGNNTNYVINLTN